MASVVRVLSQIAMSMVFAAPLVFCAEFFTMLQGESWTAAQRFVMFQLGQITWFLLRIADRTHRDDEKANEETSPRNDEKAQEETSPFSAPRG